MKSISKSGELGDFADNATRKGAIAMHCLVCKSCIALEW